MILQNVQLLIVATRQSYQPAHIFSSVLCTTHWHCCYSNCCDGQLLLLMWVASVTAGSCCSGWLLLLQQVPQMLLLLFYWLQLRLRW